MLEKEYRNNLERAGELTETERGKMIELLKDTAKREFELGQAMGSVFSGNAAESEPSSEPSMSEKLEFMMAFALEEAKDPSTVDSEQSDDNWVTAEAHMSPHAYGAALRFAMRCFQLYPETAEKMREKFLRVFEEKALHGDPEAIMALKNYADTTHDARLESRFINVAVTSQENTDDARESMKRTMESLGIKGRTIGPISVSTMPVWKYVRP